MRRRLETGLILSGAAMLVFFAAAKGWSAWESQAGVREFEAALENASDFQALASDDGQATPARVSAYHEEQPDFSQWDAKRIREYQAAIQQSPDAPHAILNIEHLDIRVPVYNGASDFNLNRGVARILGTAQLGEAGNLGIAGHRDGFFRPLKDIEVGDNMTLQTWLGTDEYRVTSINIVDKTAVEVLGPSDTTTITLVTCYPFYYVGNAPQRFIVKAEALPRQVNS